jgi:hypothetical protein
MGDNGLELSGNLMGGLREKATHLGQKKTVEVVMLAENVSKDRNQKEKKWNKSHHEEARDSPSKHWAIISVKVNKTF